MRTEKIEQLVIKAQIGNCIINIEKVTGGLSHRMYKVTTDKGIYAIKELNQGVMKRKEAYSNFVFSEKVTEIAKQNKIPAVGAMKVNSDIITKIYYKGNIDKNVDKLIYADNYGGLAWLDYNLRRSLCIENNYEQDEIELAENEVIQSIKEITYNVNQFKNMLKILNEIKNS